MNRRSIAGSSRPRVDPLPAPASDQDKQTPPWRIVPGGVLLFVRATPRASRNLISGVGVDADGRAILQLRIAAPPAEGAANAALVDLLSRALQVRKRDVSLQAGATGRTKQFFIEGNAAALIARLEVLTTA